MIVMIVISNHEKIELEETNTMAQALKIVANGNNEINLPDYDHIRTQSVSKDNIIYKQVKQSIIDFMKDNIKIKCERIIAQIFHGFGSPKYTWKSNAFWKKYINFPFLQIIQIAIEINKEKENRKNNIKNNDNNNNNMKIIEIITITTVKMIVILILINILL